MLKRIRLAFALVAITGASAIVLFLPRFSSAQAAPAPTKPTAQPAVPFINAHALIIVRHADINITLKPTLGNDTPLLPRGNQRAKELAFALKDFGITRIITSATVRAHDTAVPLADILHLAIEASSPPLKQIPGTPALDASSPEGQVVAWFDFLAETAKPTDTILLVHHHWVIPPLMVRFGLQEPPINEAEEWDRIYIILPDPVHRTYQVMRLRYGGDWGK